MGEGELGHISEGEFGLAVALSADGDTALIGAPQDDSGRGAAWVFTRSGTTWTQQGPKLTGAGASEHAQFGEVVALSGDGNTALVGARHDEGNTGAAWVFTRSGSTWTQQGEKLTGAEEVEEGRFGSSVALSEDGNTALIGGLGDDERSGRGLGLHPHGRGLEPAGRKADRQRRERRRRIRRGGRSLRQWRHGADRRALDESGTGAAWVFTRTARSLGPAGRKADRQRRERRRRIR